MSVLRRAKMSLPIVAVVALLQAGCASSYHDYPCGCVSYDYCAPPPLPYRPYAGCAPAAEACLPAWVRAEPEAGLKY